MDEVKLLSGPTNKVSDLITLLQQLDPDADLWIDDCRGSQILPGCQLGFITQLKIVEEGGRFDNPYGSGDEGSEGYTAPYPSNYEEQNVGDLVAVIEFSTG